MKGVEQFGTGSEPATWARHAVTGSPAARPAAGRQSGLEGAGWRRDIPE